MSNLNPITRLELFLAAAVGEYSGELPAPITRQEQYLKKIIEEIDSGGSVSPEQIDAAIEDYINTHGSDIVSETELSQALSGYATTAALASKADSADVPDVSGFATTADMNTALAGKVDKETGKSLMTADEHTKLGGITIGTTQEFIDYIGGKR